MRGLRSSVAVSKVWVLEKGKKNPRLNRNRWGGWRGHLRFLDEVVVVVGRGRGGDLGISEKRSASGAVVQNALACVSMVQRASAVLAVRTGVVQGVGLLGSCDVCAYWPGSVCDAS